MSYRVAAAVEHTSLLSSLACRTIVDVGANRGQFALVALRCQPSATIYSFEPLPEASRTLSSLFEENPAVVVHQAAVGPNRTVATMHVSRRDDSSSLLPIGSTQAAVFPGTEEASTQRVSVAPLTDFLSAQEIQQPALLKLDVQGFELLALQGCEALLSHFKYVYVECSFVELYIGQPLAKEVIDWLRARELGLAGIYNLVCGAQGRSIQADFFFVREAPRN